MEAVIEEFRNQMRELNGRLNVQIQITAAMWVTTMVAVLATLAAVLLRT